MLNDDEICRLMEERVAKTFNHGKVGFTFKEDPAMSYCIFVSVVDGRCQIIEAPSVEEAKARVAALEIETTAHGIREAGCVGGLEFKNSAWADGFDEDSPLVMHLDDGRVIHLIGDSE